jgi:hypothetical protein
MASISRSLAACSIPKSCIAFIVSRVNVVLSGNIGLLAPLMFHIVIVSPQPLARLTSSEPFRYFSLNPFIVLYISFFVNCQGLYRIEQRRNEQDYTAC